MEGRKLSYVMPKVYSVLSITLLFSSVRVPVTLASPASIPYSNFSFDDRASLNNTANWILNFLNECHVDAESPLIVAGNVNEKITSTIHRSTRTTLVLFTKSETSIDQAYARAKWTLDYREKGFFRFQNKARIFLVAAESQPLLRHVIKELRTSRWWNFTGRFLIFDEDLEKSSCRNAHPYLSTAWRHGLLSAVYLCLENDARKLFLYSYNPFADEAPRPGWKTIASYGTERNGYHWTLFRRELDSGDFEVSKVNEFTEELDCGEIFFDKTKNLNGYPVRISAVNLRPKLTFSAETNISNLRKYSGEDGQLAKTLWEWLNATIIEVPQTGNWGMGFTDDHGTEYGVKADIKNGKADININQRPLPFTKDPESTYPYIHCSYCFVTKSRGILPLWKNLLSSVTPLPSFLIFVMILLLIRLLISFQDKEHTGMLFDIVGILVSVHFVKLQPQFSSRFFIAGVLILIVIVNNAYQGRIAAIVTKPKYYKNIDTLDELEESGYEIHGYVAFKNIIKKPQLRRRFVTSEIDEECYKMVMSNAPVACTSDCMQLWEKSAEESKLYVAQESVLSHYSHYITRIGWPILERVNQLISRIVSAGLPKYWRDKTLFDMTIKSIAAGKTLSSSEPRTIKFYDLDAVFYALLVGLLFATLIFVVEVVISRWKYE